MHQRRYLDKESSTPSSKVLPRCRGEPAGAWSARYESYLSGRSGGLVPGARNPSAWAELFEPEHVRNPTLCSPLPTWSCPEYGHNKAIRTGAGPGRGVPSAAMSMRRRHSGRARVHRCPGTIPISTGMLGPERSHRAVASIACGCGWDQHAIVPPRI